MRIQINAEFEESIFRQTLFKIWIALLSAYTVKLSIVKIITALLHFKRREVCNSEVKRRQIKSFILIFDFLQKVQLKPRTFCCYCCCC